MLCRMRNFISFVYYVKQTVIYNCSFYSDGKIIDTCTHKQLYMYTIVKP